MAFFSRFIILLVFLVLFIWLRLNFFLFRLTLLVLWIRILVVVLASRESLSGDLNGLTSFILTKSDLGDVVLSCVRLSYFVFMTAVLLSSLSHCPAVAGLWVFGVSPWDCISVVSWAKAPALYVTMSQAVVGVHFLDLAFRAQIELRNVKVKVTLR